MLTIQSRIYPCRQSYIFDVVLNLRINSTTYQQPCSSSSTSALWVNIHVNINFQVVAQCAWVSPSCQHHASLYGLSQQPEHCFMLFANAEVWLDVQNHAEIDDYTRPLHAEFRYITRPLQLSWRLFRTMHTFQIIYTAMHIAEVPRVLSKRVGQSINLMCSSITD